MGALLVAVGGALATIFRTTNTSRDTSNAYVQARDVMETIRTQWSNPSSGAQSAYDANCIKISLPTGAAVSVSSVNTTTNATTAQTTNIVATNGTCPSGSNNQTMKRVTVTVSRNSTEISRLTLDIPRP